MKAQPSQHPETAMQLEASLPDWCALTGRQTLVCAAFVLLFLFLSYLPIPVSSTWHDAWTGGWIYSHGLYAADPSLPLSDGVRHHACGWLGRVLVYQTMQFGGLELLSFTFAVLQTLTAILWAWLATKVSGRWWSGLVVVAVTLACGWFYHGLATQTFGQLCLAILACLLLRNQTTGQSNDAGAVGLGGTWLHFAALLSTLMLWINVDGSFVIGWGLLAAMLLARAIDLLHGDGKVSSDRLLQRWLIVFELALLAALLNPLGWKLYQVLLWWPDQPMWQSLGGWQPLALVSWPGLLLAMLWIGWVASSRQTQKMQTWQWLVPMLGTSLVATCHPALLWLAPVMVVATFSMLPMVSSSQPAATTSTDDDSAQSVPLRFAFTLICGLLLWVGFAISPASVWVLGGQSRSPQQLVGSHSPTIAADFLQTRDQEQRGLLWCPNYWSDRLQVADDVTPVFANQNLSSLPPQAVTDYRLIYAGQDQWRKLLDQYNVSQLLIDKQHQPRLLRKLRKQPGDWQFAHEDDLAVVLTRRNPS